MSNPFRLVVDNLLERNSTNCPSKCPHCGKEKEPIEVVHPITKKIHKVYPACCEWKEHEKKIKVAQEYEEKRRVEKLFSLSNVGDHLQASTFENYIQREGSETAYKQAKKYAMGFDDYDISLLFWGKPGNGKSHLAAAVQNYLLPLGKTVVFQSVPELLERIRNTFNANNKETEKEIMVALQTCDLLILDDIGAEKPSDWVLDVLFRIVDGRYRKDKHILYTSNLKPAELEEKLGPRIYDRILETTLPVQNKAFSYRHEKAVERFKSFKE